MCGKRLGVFLAFSSPLTIAEVLLPCCLAAVDQLAPATVTVDFEVGLMVAISD